MVLHSHMERNKVHRSKSKSKALILLLIAIAMVSLLSFYRTESGLSFLHLLGLLTAVILLSATYVIAGRVDNESSKSTAGINQNYASKYSSNTKTENEAHSLPDPEEHGFELPLI